MQDRITFEQQHTQAEERLMAYIDQHKQRMFGMLQQLVAIESVNHVSSGGEANCAPLIEGWYRDLGLETEVYYPDDVMGDHPAHLAGRGTDTRPNVGGLYRGAEGKRCVMLAAHTDTMPIGDRADWRHDPLGGAIVDGKLYGRGSGDNKFGIATGVFLLQALRDLGLRLKQNVALSAYCDEEYGGGNGAIAACVKYPCDMYINLDGGNSDREVWTCAVGGQVLASKLTAREPQDSASLIIDGLTLLRAEVEEFGKRRRAELHAHPLYEGSDMERSAMRILLMQGGDGGTNSSRGELTFVFYTVSEKQQIMDELQQIKDRLGPQLDALGIDWDPFIPQSRYFDYIRADESDPSIRLLIQCASEAEGKPIKSAGSCLSDYFLFYKYGSPLSVSYGILRDFKLEGGAHQPDEFVYLRDFVNHAKAMGLFLLRWCGLETA
ncbi:MAG: M20 family metallopeptidase [Clostridiales bacterium]|jgi:acetylornithine deacetylase|nr:M20 family metallopeptidase [Clostridiales bacterium]